MSGKWVIKKGHIKLTILKNILLPFSLENSPKTVPQALVTGRISFPSLNLEPKKNTIYITA